MTFSKLATRTITTPYQDNGRGGTKIDRIVLHHMASTGFEGVLSMWINATRQGSANYAVSNEGEVVGAVAEENRSWSLSNYAYDARSITFEVENEALGGAWPVSQAAHEAVANVVADICQRYGIPCDRSHIVTHREVTAMGYSYLTACPGGLNADWIATRAAQIISGGAPAPQSTGDDMPFQIFNQINTNGIDRAVICQGTFGFYNVGYDWAVAIQASKGLSLDSNAWPKINEYGFFALQSTMNNDMAALQNNIKAVTGAQTQAILDALTKLPAGSGGGYTPEQVAQAVKLALQGSFDGLPAKLAEEEGKRLSNG